MNEAVRNLGDAPIRDVRLGPQDVDVERRSDGTLILRASQPLGPDRDDISALVFPDIAACRKLADAATDASDQSVLDEPRVRALFAERLASLAKASTGSSMRVVRLLLMAEPPSMDKGEATDKGSINQRAVLKNRAALVEALYTAPPPAAAITLKAP